MVLEIEFRNKVYRINLIAVLFIIYIVAVLILSGTKKKERDIFQKNDEEQIQR